MTSTFPLRKLLAAGCLMVVAGSALAQWKPTRPITLIVPWAPGGSTDQVSRVTAAELEKYLGQKIVILNQPGASGSVGTKNAMEAPKDGYTWAAGGAKDLGTYKVLGMLDTSAKDWNLYLNVAHIAVVGVNADTPYKTMKDLLDAMKAKPIKDALFGEGRIRPDGRKIHNMYLYEVKAPSEVKSEWDLAKVIRSIPGDEMIRPVNEGGCPLIK